MDEIYYIGIFQLYCKAITQIKLIWLHKTIMFNNYNIHTLVDFKITPASTVKATIVYLKSFIRCWSKPSCKVTTVASCDRSTKQLTALSKSNFFFCVHESQCVSNALHTQPDKSVIQVHY